VILNWIPLAQDKDKWRAFVKTVMKCWLQKVLGNSSVIERLIDFQEQLGSMELVTNIKRLLNVFNIVM
jgi:hypothetical protein